MVRAKTHAEQTPRDSFTHRSNQSPYQIGDHGSQRPNDSRFPFARGPCGNEKTDGAGHAVPSLGGAELTK
jgi:hypothetical protein